ncbi:hypothetical protein ACFE04_018342 [Oxalis oulophora]
MDTAQEELQFLGVVGIFKESFNIILRYRIFFARIALALFPPIALIHLAHLQITQLFSFEKVDKLTVVISSDKLSYTNFSNLISLEWIMFWLFKATYFAFLSFLSLLSNSTIVYTIACVYTGKELTIRKVLNIVPIVWKRLMVTFIWYYTVLFMCSLVALMILVLETLLLVNGTVGIPFVVCSLILFVLALAYILTIRSLACVVPVLEDAHGIKAMARSKSLLKGNVRVACTSLLLLAVISLVIGTIYDNLVVFLVDNLWIKKGVGFACFHIAILIGLVVQTVVYFVCKSYHHEYVDKPLLADHLVMTTKFL